MATTTGEEGEGRSVVEHGPWRGATREEEEEEEEEKEEEEEEDEKRGDGKTTGRGVITGVESSRTVDVSNLGTRKLGGGVEEVTRTLQTAKSGAFWNKVGEVELCYRLFGRVRVVCRDGKRSEAVAVAAAARLRIGTRWTVGRTAYRPHLFDGGGGGGGGGKRRKVSVRESDGSKAWITL